MAKADKYTEEELENFVRAIKDASVAIAEKNPRHYIVSLNGGLPLFDILGLIDRDVNPDQAVYFPGSSKINNSAQVLTRCFTNLFLEKQDETSEARPLISLDEVVSGHSVKRVMNAWNKASREIARSNLGNSHKQRDYVEAEAKKLRGLFPLFVFGIREVRKDGKTVMNREYLNGVKGGQILEFPTKRIITMDDLDYQTVRFDHPRTSGFKGQCYFPKVKEIVLSREYLSLLKSVAKMVGVDPESVEPHRARVESDCEKYSTKPKKSK